MRVRFEFDVTYDCEKSDENEEIIRELMEDLAKTVASHGFLTSGTDLEVTALITDIEFVEEDEDDE